MDFEWDPNKAASNLAKHGVDFADAIDIFDDPRLLLVDPRRYGERRYKAIGTVRGRVLFVAYTMRGGVCAASSAPGGPADVKEQPIRHRAGNPKPRSATDWHRLDRMSDEEVEAAALDDPDAQPLGESELARMFRPRQLAEFRKRMGMSQSQFAAAFHLNLRTLQDWEQGRREPEEIARAYLRVIARHPDTVAEALKD